MQKKVYQRSKCEKKAVKELDNSTHIIYHMLGTILNASPVLTNLILTTTPFYRWEN